MNEIVLLGRRRLNPRDRVVPVVIIPKPCDPWNYYYSRAAAVAASDHFAKHGNFSTTVWRCPACGLWHTKSRRKWIRAFPELAKLWSTSKSC